MCGGKCGESASTIPAAANPVSPENGGNAALNTMQAEVQKGTDTALAADGLASTWFIDRKSWGK